MNDIVSCRTAGRAAVSPDATHTAPHWCIPCLKTKQKRCERVCVCVLERKRVFPLNLWVCVCICICEQETEGVSACVHIWVCVFACVCMCVCGVICMQVMMTLSSHLRFSLIQRPASAHAHAHTHTHTQEHQALRRPSHSNHCTLPLQSLFLLIFLFFTLPLSTSFPHLCLSTYVSPPSLFALSTSLSLQSVSFMSNWGKHSGY